LGAWQKDQIPGDAMLLESIWKVLVFSVSLFHMSLEAERISVQSSLYPLPEQMFDMSHPTLGSRSAI
jgi:hypothetical protein